MSYKLPLKLVSGLILEDADGALIEQLLGASTVAERLRILNAVNQRDNLVQLLHALVTEMAQVRLDPVQKVLLVKAMTYLQEIGEA